MEEIKNVLEKTSKKKVNLKILIGALSLLLLGGIIFSLFYFSDNLKQLFFDNKENAQNNILNIDQNIFEGFSKLRINAANAKDNFSLEALQSDIVGVESSSSYLLNSKEPLSLNEIKENLVIKPAVEYELKEVSDKEWEIIPQENFEANEIVSIALNTSYIDEEGEENNHEYSWAFQVKDNFKVLHSIPRHAGVGVPTNTGIEITFSHEGFFDYDKYFSINPSVPGRFEVHARTLVFVPENELKPGALYTVNIDSDLPIKDSSQKLFEDYAFTFETNRVANKNRSWLGVYNRSIETNPQYAPIIQVASYNSPEKVDIDLFQFKDSEQLSFTRSHVFPPLVVLCISFPPATKPNCSS